MIGIPPFRVLHTNLCVSRDVVFNCTSPHLLQVLRDSPFLDLSSPMTVYEWFKAVLLFPWFVVKMVVFILGFVIVTGSVRVKPPLPRSPSSPRSSSTCLGWSLLPSTKSQSR